MLEAMVVKVSSGFTFRGRSSSGLRMCNLNVEVRELLVRRTVSARPVQSTRRHQV